MKKILMAVFATLAFAAWVVPAMAVDTTFYGTERVRLFSTNNSADYNSSGDSKLYSGSGSTVTTTTGGNPTRYAGRAFYGFSAEWSGYTSGDRMGVRPF